MPRTKFDEKAPALAGVTTGVVTGTDPEGAPLVTWEGREGTPVAARVAWLPHLPDWARAEGLPVLLAAPHGESPIVLGLLAAPPDAPAPDEAESIEDILDRAPSVLRIRGRKAIVLECGEAKITLRADGRIEIRGGHLVSRSSGPNRIKGATVEIN